MHEGKEKAYRDNDFDGLKLVITSLCNENIGNYEIHETRMNMHTNQLQTFLYFLKIKNILGRCFKFKKMI